MCLMTIAITMAASWASWCRTVPRALGLAGAFAGAVSVLATMPQDTVKTRMQGDRGRVGGVI